MRKEVSEFATRMEARLKEKDSKYDGWDNVSIDYLTLRLRQETADLLKSLTIYHANPHEFSLELVQKECVDISNYAMMISDLAEKRQKKDREDSGWEK